MDHPSVIAVIISLAGAAIAMLLYSATLTALKMRQMNSARAVHLLAVASTVALYVISPLAYDALVGSLFQRKGVNYVAVDLAWWIELAPCLFAIVAVTLVRVSRRRQNVKRLGISRGVS